MREKWLIAFALPAVLATGLSATATRAADDDRAPRLWADPPPPIALRPSFISQTRFGMFAQDPWSPEGGSANVHGEILFAKPFTPRDLFASYFVPHPHVGASLNLAGRTSFAFAGLTWNVDVTPDIFVEASLGGAVHDGHRGGDPIRDNQAALGCTGSLRESASLGYRINDRLSFMATVEHYGNAGLCAENRGLTNIGARIGYSF